MCIRDRASFDRLADIGTQIRRGLTDLFATHSLGWQVTGAGSLFRIHPHQRPINSYRDAHLDSDETALMESLQHRLLEHEVYFSSYGMGCMNLATSDSDIEHFENSINEALTAIRS